MIERGGGRGSLEKKEEKKRKEKKRVLIIKIILFNWAQNLTSSEQYPNITENREYYPEM